MIEAPVHTLESSTGQDMYTELSAVSHGYEYAFQRDVTGADVVDISLRIKEGVKRRYPLWSFTFGKAPLSAWLYHEDGLWFAEIDDLNVYSEGESTREAIAELEEHLKYFKGFYNEVDERELTVYAIGLKNKFARLIQLD